MMKIIEDKNEQHKMRRLIHYVSNLWVVKHRCTFNHLESFQTIPTHRNNPGPGRKISWEELFSSLCLKINPKKISNVPLTLRIFRVITQKHYM